MGLFGCAHLFPPMVNRVASISRSPTGPKILTASQQCCRVTSTGVSMNVFILGNIKLIGFIVNNDVYSHSFLARPCAKAHLVRSAVFRNPYFL